MVFTKRHGAAINLGLAFALAMSAMPELATAQNSVHLREYRILLRGSNTGADACENQTIKMVADEAYRFVAQNRGEPDRSWTVEQFREAGEKYASSGCSRNFFLAVASCVGSQKTLRSDEDVAKSAERLSDCLTETSSRISPLH